LNLYRARPWNLQWWLNLIVRRRIRKFVRRCTAEGIFSAPILDAGCGYRSSYPEIQIQPYHTLDLAAELKPDYVGDICNMLGIPDNRYRSIVCTEVLEHVRGPIAALEECWRVLQPGGSIVITTPFWYPIHEKPYQEDHWRFTETGIKILLERAGFTDIKTENAGRKLRPTGVFTVARKP